MIHAVVFDLGNVLLHFDHRIIASRFSGAARGTSGDGAWPPDLASKAEAFSRGDIGEEAFLDNVGPVFGEDARADRAVAARLWSDIFWPNEPLVALLPALAARVRLVLLSNTDPLHIAFARSRFPELFRNFHACVYSYELGAAKPDPAMYDAAAAAAGAPAERCLYFDDVVAYVRAAEQRGLRAFPYVSLDGVRDVLALHGLAPHTPDAARVAVPPGITHTPT